MVNYLGMNPPPSSSTCRHPKYFPNTVTALVTRALADPMGIDWQLATNYCPPVRCRTHVAPSVGLWMTEIHVLTQHTPLSPLQLGANSCRGRCLRENITAHQLNDEAIRRALKDWPIMVARCWPSEVPTCGRTKVRYPPQQHIDTTAFALCGDYPNSGMGPAPRCNKSWGHAVLQVAAIVNIAPQTWQDWESGQVPVPLDAPNVISEGYGAPLKCLTTDIWKKANFESTGDWTLRDAPGLSHHRVLPALGKIAAGFAIEAQKYGRGTVLSAKKLTATFQGLCRATLCGQGKR